jgi:hypothetical protein
MLARRSPPRPSGALRKSVVAHEPAAVKPLERIEDTRRQLALRRGAARCTAKRSPSSGACTAWRQRPARPGTSRSAAASDSTSTSCPHRSRAGTRRVTVGAASRSSQRRAAVLSERFVDALNEQIGREFAAAHQYVGIGAHYAAQTCCSRTTSRARRPASGPASTLSDIPAYGYRRDRGTLVFRERSHSPSALLVRRGAAWRSRRFRAVLG